MKNPDLTLKDLNAHNITFERAMPTTATYQTALDNYRSYIKGSTSLENSNAAMKRLADLELESSENDEILGGESDIFSPDTLILSSINHYNNYLNANPGREKNDHVLYQLTKAYSYKGDTELALEKMNTIIQHYPNSQHIDEVQFRRGEILFVTGDYKNAEAAYASIIERSHKSKFHENSLYKLGWSQFKQSKYLKALSTYFSILDLKQTQGALTSSELSKDLTRGEEDFINDTLRAITLSLSYTNGTETIDLFFSDNTSRNYDALIYKRLGEFYLTNNRHLDAANVFLAYGKTNPNNPLAAQYASLAIKAFSAGNFHDLVLSTKKSFVEKYDVNTSFWGKQTQENRDIIKIQLALHIKELASHYHALAQKSKNQKNLQQAISWYNNYLTSLPNEPDTPIMNFMLAELLFDSKLYEAALKEYINTGYNYPQHSKNAESAYASILTYNKLIEISQPASRDDLKARALNNSILFSNTYPEDKNAPKVITRTAEDLFAAKDYKKAIEFAKRITYKSNLNDQQLVNTAWTVYAHSLFELQDYIGAEHAYIEVLKRTSKNTKNHAAISDKLAASIYKQGESKRGQGNFELAAFHFIRLGEVAPLSPIRVTAEYDAASMYIKLEQWDKASKTLEGLKSRFPNHKIYSRGITENLALTYTHSGRFDQAADQIAILATIATTAEDKQSFTWQSAEMYNKAGNTKKSNNIYINYIKQYPKPFSQNIEAHKFVSDYYLGQKQLKTWSTWLKKTVDAEARGGDQRTDRSNLIAAQAVMHLAKPLVENFNQAKLTIPLNKSLKKKKRLMQVALKTYTDVIKYQIAETTTESTYHIAEIYHHFAQALMQSQRPEDLSVEELELYDILLEEQAYPFEEKTIGIHSSNVKRTRDGIYDKWVKQSFKVLSEMQPIRYFKNERTEDYVSATH